MVLFYNICFKHRYVKNKTNLLEILFILWYNQNVELCNFLIVFYELVCFNTMKEVSESYMKTLIDYIEKTANDESFSMDKAFKTFTFEKRMSPSGYKIALNESLL